MKSNQLVFKNILRLNKNKNVNAKNKITKYFGEMLID
jgi:hypothetical protein